MGISKHPLQSCLSRTTGTGGGVDCTKYTSWKEYANKVNNFGMQFFWGLGGRQYWYWQQALNIVHILCTRWQKTSLPGSSSAFCKQCSSIIVWGGTICLSVAHSGICLASVPRLVDCHLFHCHHRHNKVKQPRILTCSVSSHWKIDSGQCLCK